MNTCPQLPVVGAYHDGEMPPSERAQLEAHLRDCPQCAAELASLRALSGAFQCVPWPAMPLDLAPRIHVRINRAAERGPMRLAGSLAALAALIALVCLLQLSTIPAAAAPPASNLDAVVLLASADASVNWNDESAWIEWTVRDLSASSAPKTTGPAVEIQP